MARMIKQVVYRPDTIMGLLNRWDDSRVLGINVPKNSTVRMYALPDSREAFKPNAPAMYAMLQALHGSIRQHLSGTRANYNSFMSMYSRWKKDFEDYLKWKSEIELHKRVHELASSEYIAARDALDRACTGWVSYEAWLQILGKAGVLDPALVAAIPRTMVTARENLMRMYREWLELEDAIPPAQAVPLANKAQEQGAVEKSMIYGTVAMPDEIFNAVGSVPEMDGVTLDGMVEGGNTVFNGYRVYKDVRADLTGCVFVNCVFRDVVFRGHTEGVMFIACDFEGECRIASGTCAENMMFKKCCTIDGVLAMHNTTLSGLRMYQCEGMTVNVRRSCISNSHIVDGWVNCGRAANDKGNWDAQRVAPRTINNALWENGGLVYDNLGGETSGIAESKVESAFIRATVNAVIPASMRLRMVRDLRGGLNRCCEAAEQLFEERGMDTRELAYFKWEEASDEMYQEQQQRNARHEEVRRGAAQVASKPREAVNPLEAIVLAEYEEAPRQQSEE